MQTNGQQVSSFRRKLLAKISSKFYAVAIFSFVENCYICINNTSTSQMQTTNLHNGSSYFQKSMIPLEFEVTYTKSKIRHVNVHEFNFMKHYCIDIIDRANIHNMNDKIQRSMIYKICKDFAEKHIKLEGDYIYIGIKRNRILHSFDSFLFAEAFNEVHDQYIMIDDRVYYFNKKKNCISKRQLKTMSAAKYNLELTLKIYGKLSKITDSSKSKETSKNRRKSTSI